MMVLFTPCLRSFFSRCCVLQPIVLRASGKFGSQPQALPVLRPSALFQVAFHPAASVSSFHARRVGVLASRSSSSVGTRGLCSSVKKESKSVQIGHPCMDSVFRHGFADPSILKDFLNVILEFEGAEAIEEIIYLPKALPPAAPESNTGYHFTVDVRCRTKSGRHFVIEMQNDFRNDYHVKALVEHSRMLSHLDKDQTAADRSKRTAKNVNDRNKFWKGVEGLYTIIVTNKRLPSKKLKSYYSAEALMEPFVVNPYELRHTKQLDRHFGDIPIQIVFLMLDNLTPPHIGQILTPVERWAHVLRDPALRSGVAKIPKTKTIHDVEALAGDVKSIRSFIERLDVTKLPAAVKESYEHAVDYHNGALIDIEEKATKKGEEKILRKFFEWLKAQGKSNQEIAETTCCSLEIVERLLSTNYDGSADS